MTKFLGSHVPLPTTLPQDFVVNLEEIFPWYYMHTDVVGSNMKHYIVLQVANRLKVVELNCTTNLEFSGEVI